MVVQEVHWCSGFQWFSLTLFNGLRVNVELCDFPACRRAFVHDRAFEPRHGAWHDRGMTKEFIALMHQEADAFMERNPHLARRDDLKQPLKQPLALEPLC